MILIMLENNSQEASPYYTNALITGIDGVDTCHFWIASEQKTLCDFYLNYVPEMTFTTTHHNFCSECSRLMNALEDRIFLIEDRIAERIFMAGVRKQERQERREEQERAQQKWREEQEKLQQKQLEGKKKVKRILPNLRKVTIVDAPFRFSSFEIVNPTTWDLGGHVIITYYIINDFEKNLFRIYVPLLLS